MKSLDWKRLQSGECPQCGRKIDRIPGDDFACRCGFFCRGKRVEEIIADINKADPDQAANDFFISHGVDPKSI